MNAKDFNSTKFCTIKEALEISGMDNPYFRKLIYDGKIEAIKSAIPGTKIERYLVSRESLAAYMSKSKHNSRRDGRNKFILYATPAEFEALTKLLEKGKLDLPLARANVKKTE